jgi:hypothetical protein
MRLQGVLVLKEARNEFSRPCQKPKVVFRRALEASAWFATFTVLDISSATRSAHLERLIAPFKKFWHKTFGNTV